jgi:acyl-CoA reductase-like NAD-dependent aldehyde dehydrogenase
VSRQQYGKVVSYIEEGKRSGLRVLTGGGRPAGADMQQGFYVQPTVFAEVPTGRGLHWPTSQLNLNRYGQGVDLCLVSDEL